MPSLKKKALSLYLRNGCQRQLVLNLYSDKERKANGMPVRQQARAGLGLTGAMGYEWQDEKVSELGDVFGKDAVHINPVKKGKRPSSILLPSVLLQLKPYQFIVEGHYDAATQTFMDAVGISALQDAAGQPLGVGDALPDLIQVLPPAATPTTWEVVQQDIEPVATMQAVQPNGSADLAKRLRWAAREAGKSTGFQEVFLVDQRNLTREREELLKFLRALRSIITTVEEQDEQDVNNFRRGNPNEPKKLKRSTYQIYLWDEAQRKQLTRGVGQHLPAILADSKLRDLAWLFPPPELLTPAEEASYKSAFTFVSAIVQNTVAVPIPHHYTLLEVSKTIIQPRSMRSPSIRSTVSR